MRDMSRFKTSAKLFTYICIVSIVIFLISIFHDVLVNHYKSVSNKNINFKDVRYILLWTDRNSSPLDTLEKERKAFFVNKCKYTNCYVTDNRNYFDDITLFDAVVFDGRSLSYLNKTTLPKIRSHRQKYVYVILESSQNRPVCSKLFDNFFNWTWTYRLDSDVAWTYFIAYNNSGIAVAPSKTVSWIKSDNESRSEEISEELKYKLNRKTKAAAWFVSHCNTKSKRENYIFELRYFLWNYYLDVDIYGTCEKFKCPRIISQVCNEMLANDYYFYLSFENSLVEDYVTEKVITALNHDTVPVVFGGANYTRFLPSESYLNAMELSPKQLAMRMNEIIRDPTKQSYYNFFKWRNYYEFKDSIQTRVCDICALMNDWNKVRVRSSYENFREWWNPSGHVC